MATRAACLLGLARALRAPRFALRAATTSPPPPPEAYVEVVLHTGGAHSDTPSAEELSEVLMEYGAMSVSASDSNAGTDAEEALYGEPPDAKELDVFLDEDRWRSEAYWRSAEVRALFVSEDYGVAVLDALRDRYGDGVLEDMDGSLEPLPSDVDWLQKQEAARPVVVVGDLEILLPWHDTSPDPDVAKRQLRVEGGAAFGTGEHQTTRMCCEWLQEAKLPAMYTMVDYGCGSGILALTALRYGAAVAVGVDIDVDCVAAAKRNAESNGFAPSECRFHLPPVDAGADAASVAYVNARLETGDFGHDPLPSDEPPADVVVANILLNPLLALQDTITGLVKVGGTQVMSGIRLDQADRVIAAYGPKFDDVRVAKETDGWLVVVASGRKAD